MKRLLIISISGILFFVFNASQCKAPSPPSAVVYVVTVDDQNKTWPVMNAEVRLEPPQGTSQPDLLEYNQKPKLTDINGKVTYDFKYEGIIKVVAQKTDGSVTTCGQGVLILKDGSTYQETVRLSACY